MDQSQAKKILQDLSKREDLANKICADCSNPNPQWASLSFAIFICLQCAGQHRGYGVHVSFVRSITMDTWQEDQIRRMQLGGNRPMKEFLENYTPAEQGGYTQSMNSYDKYHCHAATQYREKLDADLAGTPWTPSAPLESSTGLSSSSTLRKARASTRQTSAGSRGTSSSPHVSSPTYNSEPFDQKAANERFFASLGEANAARPPDLPPSQGGRYQGFGNTPTLSQHPSYGLSSAAVPSLSEIQENPLAALGKGWSLFSSAVSGASRVVNENVIQPGMDKVRDPTFQSTVSGYLTEAQRVATQAGSSANHWSREQLGIDVADKLGGVVDGVRDRIGGGPSSRGYGSLAQTGYGEETSLYNDDDDDDFFNRNSHHQSPVPPPKQTATASTAADNKKADDWDDWKGWD